MADNTFNFDLDAPAVPTLTLDPAPAQEQAQPKQPEPAAAPEAQVKLSPEEQAMVDQFAEKIDITNSQQVLQYGSACQKKIGDFSEAALSKVRQSAARKPTATNLQFRFPFKNAEKYKPSDFRHSCRSLGFVFLYYLIYILFVYVCGMIMFSVC